MCGTGTGTVFIKKNVAFWNSPDPDTHLSMRIQSQAAFLRIRIRNTEVEEKTQRVDLLDYNAGGENTES